MPQDSSDGGLKRGLWDDKTEDEVAIGREIVEMSGMNYDVMVAQELNGEILIGDMSGAGPGGCPPVAPNRGAIAAGNDSRGGEREVVCEEDVAEKGEPGVRLERAH